MTPMLSHVDAEDLEIEKLTAISMEMDVLVGVL